jgi:MFS family permease
VRTKDFIHTLHATNWDEKLSAPAEIERPCPSAPPATDRLATFSSLHTRNYRLFASGQLVSNTGAWVQRIAQDWLVLSLTGSATAVGITTALQFLPTLLFGLVGGLIADRHSKRTILLATQVGMSSMAAALAILTLTHEVQAWHVYVIAFGLGIVTSVDNPTRQSFVNEMVGPDQLRNAISLNASVFQLGALIGPAISGFMINAVGSGYSFVINAFSYLAPMIALSMIREDELTLTKTAASTDGRLRDGLSYVWRRPHMLWPTLLVGAFGLFTINLPVTLAAYAKTVFHSGASGYGMLSSAVALGSIGGALISTRWAKTRLRTLAGFGALLSVLEVLAAAAPGQWSYSVMLIAVGAATLLLLTSANSSVQLAAHDSIRGRVMGVYLLVFIGSGALGGPLLGSIDQHLGPRVGMLLAGLVPAIVTIVVALKLGKDGQLRVQLRPNGTTRPLLALVPR